MKTPKYWVSLEDLEQREESREIVKNEFSGDLKIEDALDQAANEENLDLQTNRRDFLKLFGFGLSAATLAACNKTPLKKAIPYVIKPDDITPGVANYYSSTCDGCSAACGVLVKTREGRPIKMEGNPDSKISNGALCAIGFSTVLGLYDIDRLKQPLKGDKDASWEDVDKEIGAKLESLKGGTGRVRVLTETIVSPSTQKAIDEFLAQFPDGQHVMYDPESASGMMIANEKSFGKRAIPSYHFDKAEVIAGFNCDFLGTWLSPVMFAKNYIQNRDPKGGKMSRHFQFESMLSTTGAKADLRFPIKPSQEGVALLNLYNKLAVRMGQPAVPGVPEYSVANDGIQRLANELADAQGKSIVVSGSNSQQIQAVVNAINAMLGNYGQTIDLDNPMHTKKGDDAALKTLVDDIKGKRVDALLVYNANPVYNTVYGEELKEAIPNLGLSVSFAYKTDETSAVCGYTCPDHHNLESWNDANPMEGYYSITQPTINPIFDTRQAQDSFLAWTGNETSYYDFLQDNWKKNVLTGISGSFQEAWDDSVKYGVYEKDAKPASAATFAQVALENASNKLISRFNNAGDTQVVLYSKISMGDGKHANNPWLQELPDPISRVTWDNYLTVPVAYADEKGIKDGAIMKVEAGGTSVELPAVRQPGQAMGTFGIALGYGRTEGGKTIRKVGGANAFRMATLQDNSTAYEIENASITATGGTYKIAKFQKFDLLRDPAKEEQFGDGYDRSHHIIKETTLTDYKKDPTAGNEEKEELKKHLYTLWDSHFEDPETKRFIRWVMAIDLNKCTGCGACVVSCHSENNVPVVGKQEIINHRDMHWMRIDRYYSGDMENPDVVFQPLMCQHCDNAPCETVCPVLATIHSSEGLNQMAYNRCVGTRYCANNCPYKVRRFNWFLYHSNDAFDFHLNNDLGKLVLNPDVTVRYRGVMEKCSFCAQRLQEAKLKAKIAGDSTFAKPKDGDVQTACMQACPTGAIVFGDLNDPESHVSKLFRDERSYRALEEVKTLPSVSYMTLVRNRKEDEGHSEGHTSHTEKEHA